MTRNHKLIVMRNNVYKSLRKGRDFGVSCHPSIYNFVNNRQRRMHFPMIKKRALLKAIKNMRVSEY